MKQCHLSILSALMALMDLMWSLNIINLVHKLLQALYILKRSKCTAITIYSVIIGLLMLEHRHWNLNLLRMRLSLNYIWLQINN